MPDQAEVIQVDTTKSQKGTVKFFGNPKLKTPTILARVTKALRYFSVGIITMVSATDLFSGGEAKIINFGLGVFILLLGSVDMFVGVEPEVKQPVVDN